MKGLQKYNEFAKDKYKKDRVEEIIKNICKVDMEYITLQEREKKKFEELKENLKEDKKKLLYEYATLKNDKFVRMIECLIEQVIEDIGKF